MIQKLFNIDGMSCGHCVKQVNGALANLPGIATAQVKVGSALITYDPSAADEQAIRQAIEEAGYEVREAGAESDALPVARTSCCSMK